MISHGATTTASDSSKSQSTKSHSSSTVTLRCSTPSRRDLGVAAGQVARATGSGIFWAVCSISLPTEALVAKWWAACQHRSTQGPFVRSRTSVVRACLCAWWDPVASCTINCGDSSYMGPAGGDWRLTFCRALCLLLHGVRFIQQHPAYIQGLSCSKGLVWCGPCCAGLQTGQGHEHGQDTPRRVDLSQCQVG